MSATSVQRLLVNETKASYEYEADRALRLWDILVREVPENDNRGYTDGSWLNDEGRIILLFELLTGSIFGDMIFGSTGDDDQGSTLVQRRRDA